MAEVVGTVIGVVGFFGQMFDGCVKAYGYFSTATQMDTESQRLMCKVRIEEMRLVVWGREWGVAEGKLDAHLDIEKNPQLRALATQILQELHSTVTDFRKLQERYGLVDANAVDGDGSSGGRSSNTSRANSMSSSVGALPEKGKKSNDKFGLKSEKSWKKDATLRAKWVIKGAYCPPSSLAYADKKQTRKSFKSYFVILKVCINNVLHQTGCLLTSVTDFNDGLENLFPPSQLPSIQRAWTNRLLDSAERDLAQLSLLENASSGIYPQLNASANLKKLRINLDSKPQSAFKPTFALKVHRDALELSTPDPTCATTGISSGRCHARHELVGDVVVEWVHYDADMFEERFAHVKRLDDLAKMMHSASSSHPDLHSIDCVGYTDDKVNSRYGLVYNAPAPSFSTLHALISSSDLKTPDLDERIKLARTLAISLWSLHSLDWLHKSLCASNILFFPSAFSSSAQSSTASAALVPDISSPFLSGFDASRPDLDIALSMVPKKPSILDLYRHPDSRRGTSPYCKSFDIYSLGLVLLEIGLWKVLQTYHKPHYSADRWRDKVVLAVLVPGLGSKVGRRYRDVVEMCLKADSEATGSAAGNLMEQVVTALESIRV